MKQVLTVFMAVILTLSATAQFRNIPSEVTTAFKEKYPEATRVSWEDRISNFQAKFVMDDVTYEARFDKNGNWQETEKDMKFDDLPDAVKSAFRSSKFRDYTIRTVAYIENNSGGTEYRLYVRDNVLQRKYLYYAEDGTFLKDETKI